MLAQIILTFPDQTSKAYPNGVTPLTIIEGLDGEARSRTIALKVDGRLWDLHTPVTENSRVEPLSFESSEGREVFRHSSSHLMAQAVKRVFPGAKLAIGPAIEDGFYYDIDYDRPLTPEDLEKIEATMGELARAALPIRRQDLSKAEATRFFRERGEPYKVEIIEGIPDPTVSLYQQGDFVDLCEGPHLPTTAAVTHFKLMAVAGAYWRGDERNRMLQRIYGTSFPTKEALEAHLARLEEAKRRDHRKLGRDLDLFSMTDEVGPGLVLWHPKGARIRRTIEDHWRAEHDRAGYDLVFSPHVAKLDLWRKSGHVDFYRENMFTPMDVDGVEYELKPMNCPFHIMVYKSHPRSYRELPLRFAELGTVYRFERSGVLHGLMRVRGFTQDDAHLFCRPDQLQPEITKVLEFITAMLTAFGFPDYDIYLSTRPEKYVGALASWDLATSALEGALQAKGLRYEVDPGEGVFYGPKIDIKIKDVLKRSWQCATVQVDFNFPDRFGLRYTGEDGKEHQPIMIHRALLGSLERFLGVLIEHYGGAFPTWLAPIQAIALPIADRVHPYAHEVVRALRERGVRAELDARNEKVGLKIREAQLAKIPYMLIIGDREAAAGTVSVRGRDGQETPAQPIDAVAAHIQDEIQRKDPGPAPMSAPASAHKGRA
ncbi:MAG: threonine--tRNA ligase [Nitrospirae bacterium]|nr:threonine--tRNA ligase [Nitrospirota bacterium]